MKISHRAQKVEPFYVMEVFKEASKLAKEVAHTDKPMIFLSVGEPDFTAPALVQEAAARAITKGHTQYTNANGMDSLREKISTWYAQRFNVNVPASRIVITAGASAALQLACLALVDAGDEILMPDPSYPCNRHFVHAADGVAKLIATTPEERFQLSAAKVQANWGAKTTGVLLASPSNPTGTSIHPDELRKIHEFVGSKGGITMIDEIYLGLSHDATFGKSALELGDNIISINSFSKYFNMTGWRLGWLVVPEKLVSPIERLAQNLYICASSISQAAGLACFEPESIATYEQRRAEFKARRDYFLPALKELGFNIPVEPDGAFYVYADASPLFAKLGVNDSWDFAFEIMRRAHVAITPGRDFGTDSTANFVRFSTASSMQDLQTAISRIREALN
ncbi:pyridoxal phosphate-dependent aminotransferase [Variovorax sp. PCZ-1]|uniref:pyridoxal phosphate-dependent aminotransferase n=1 Tax=Variovorax sp. PCZ-1 TaxID=2835533 RepID=UPI001BCD102F|nr:pyridoxal phosphate-dependent aminotransferase [Variovorax sp. PCZ-1]MBS7807522.1 pyridoxal phosphate-dependent aminotransferase [Variovorax sp. PCZ-1]